MNRHKLKWPWVQSYSLTFNILLNIHWKQRETICAKSQVEWVMRKQKEPLSLPFSTATFPSLVLRHGRKIWFSSQLKVNLPNSHVLKQYTNGSTAIFSNWQFSRVWNTVLKPKMHVQKMNILGWGLHEHAYIRENNTHKYILLGKLLYKNMRQNCVQTEFTLKCWWSFRRT